MTDDRDKPSRAQESLARTTARDVPFVRGAGSESEPAPRGQRPEQLPRDPTYEAELAQVELAVLRDRDRRDDPSTKQGGRFGHQLPVGQPPESVTPESPGTRGRDPNGARSPEPPRSSGRAVASGTLLSVGAVDPRGKTERTLETPRMYFSQADAAGEAYFKPGKIPAVTVHQTIETETVKLSDSVDPRRAKTLPRIDRAALLRHMAQEGAADSESGFAQPEQPSQAQPSEQPSSLGLDDDSARWNQDEYDTGSLPSHLQNDGQIHASLSPFRDQAEASLDYSGVPTRAEPLAGRGASQPPPSVAPPDPSTVPTQRDLPQHRIEASLPPPVVAEPRVPSAPRAASAPRAQLDSDGEIPQSEGPLPTTASIAAEEDAAPRAGWTNWVAFGVALLLALAIGWWLTSGSGAPSQAEVPPQAPPAPAKVTPPGEVAPAPPAPAAPAPAGVVAPPQERPADVAAPQAESRPAPHLTPPARPPAVAPAPPRAQPAVATPAPRKSEPSKAPRETIF
jgi:hypothetical protein